MTFMLQYAKTLVSPINPLIAEGIATHELRGMVSLVDACYRAALCDPQGLMYRGMSACDPLAEVTSEVFKKNGSSSSIETAMSDMRLYHMHLEYAGMPLKPVPIRLLFPRDYNMLLISGKMKSVAALLGDQCLGTNNGKEVFVRFKRARFVVKQLTHVILVNGLFMSQPVPWAQIHNDKTDSSGKKVASTRRGRAKPALFAYLLAVYGLDGAFEKVCGTAPIFVRSDDKETRRKFDNDGSFSLITSTCKKPSRGASADWRAPEMVVYVKHNDVTQEMLICLGSFFYLVEYHPKLTDTMEKINSKIAWLVLLGNINMGDLLFSTLKLAMTNHIDSVHRYFDDPSKRNFEELGIHVEDTYSLLAYLVSHTNLLLCTSTSKVADVACKQVGVLADMAFTVTSAVFRLTFKLSQMTSKRKDPLSVSEIESLLRAYLKKGDAFKANHSPAARNTAVVGDLRLPHLTRLVSPNKVDPNNIPFTPADAAHASQLITQIGALTTTQPYGKTALNPFAGDGHRILVAPCDPELYAETQELLDEKL